MINTNGVEEDLECARCEDHLDGPARGVRERAPGESALAALRRQFLAALAEHDPATGLNDVPRVRAMQQLMMSTPALLLRVRDFAARSAEAVAAAFAEQTGAAPGDLTPRFATEQAVAVRFALGPA